MEQNDFDPVVVNGEPYWVSLISPKGKLKLLRDSDFRNAMLHARERSVENPLFKNADFMYANHIIFVYDKIRTILGGSNPGSVAADASDDLSVSDYTGIGGGLAASDLHQTMMFGANAVALANSDTRIVGRKEDDFGNIIGTGVDMIFGAQRIDWAPESGTAINQSGLMIVNSLV